MQAISVGDSMLLIFIGISGKSEGKKVERKSQQRIYRGENYKDINSHLKIEFREDCGKIEIISSFINS